MSTPIPCEHCQHSLNEAHVGPCPACGHTRVSADAWWVTPAPPPLPTPVVPAKVLTPIPPPLPAAQPRPVPILLAVGGALVLALVVCTLAVLALPKRPGVTPPNGELAQTNNPQPVTPSNDIGLLAQLDPLARPVTLVAELGPPPRQDVAEILPLPMTVDPAPIVEKAKPAAPAKFVVKRRAEVSEDELLRQLEKVPELRLDRTPRRLESEQILTVGRKARSLGGSDDVAVAHMEKRADLVGLPWLKGDDCKITPAAASNLHDGSLALRDFMSDVSRPRPRPSTRPDPKRLHEELSKDGRDHNRWLKSEAIPALQQLLMAEDEAVREVLVDQLARIDGKKASVALAQRALFDLHPRVRERALLALEKRPAAEYRDTLLSGFHFPWPAIAEHAAEAVIALKMKDAITPLLSLLDAPPPTAPYQDEKKGMVVKEMVRVNHLLNCVMCHAPSTKPDDKVRGRVPSTSQPLPPAFSRQYYSDGTGTFVRAEVTYLRQDFSVPLKVANAGLWPEVQRFDFLVRERPIQLDELFDKTRSEREATPHMQAVFFALRELTGSDPGPRVEDWKKHFLGRRLDVSASVTGLKNGRAVAADRDGNLYVADGETILRKSGDAKPTAWLTETPGIESLAFDAKGKLLAAQGKLARVLGIDVASKDSLTRAGKLDNKPLAHPRKIAPDAGGGFYLTDDDGDRGVVYYVSAHGSVTPLKVDVTRPRALAISPNGKTLYVASASTAEIRAYAITSAGTLGKGKRLARIEGGIADLAADATGNLSVLVSSEQCVYVLTPLGAKLAIARLPDAPVACAMRDTTLHVLTKKAVYAIDVSAADVTRTAMRK